jgi:predicted glycosyltransferase
LPVSFPEFTDAKRKVLFFSRGRGRGHATPDAEIARAAEVLCPDLEVRMVSYATGAGAIQELGIGCIDLCLPETAPIVHVSVLAGKLIHWLQPDIVISHEEFAIAPAAQIFGVPVIFITEWFTRPAMYSMECLRLVDEVLFLGYPGIFAEPPWVQGRVRYLGPLRRAFSYSRCDRRKARVELDIPVECTVVAVFPGSWREAETPILDSVLKIFEQLAGPKKLIWLAGPDYALVSERLALEASALVLQSTTQIDRLMAAADVAITKTNRNTVLELVLLGVPTVAVSFGINPPDERIVASLPAVRIVPPEGLHARVVEEMLHSEIAPAELRTCTAADCARWVICHLEKGRHRRLSFS